METVTMPQSRLTLGVARGDVTPPVGIYHRLWGAATHERASGVHRPLTATAVWMAPLPDSPSASTSPKCLIAIDHCLLWGTEQDRFLATLSARTGLPVDRITISWSHTHAGGLIDLSRQHLPGGEHLEPYFQQLESTVAALVHQARSTAVPAIIRYGMARCDLARERDYWDDNSRQYVCGFNPRGQSDDTVIVALATSVDSQRLLMTLVNYACHPTTLAFKNSLISPDFPGAMREVVEREFSAPCVFLQGASGDLGPREGFVGDPNVADRNGRQLGFAALSGMMALGPPETQFEYTGPVVSGATLGIWEWKPQSQQAATAASCMIDEEKLVSLAYRPELPTMSDVERERADWITKKQSAQKAGDEIEARNCHAMIERMDRQVIRLRVLPPETEFPFPVRIWQIGQAVWVLVEGEQYQILQTELRRRFPDVVIIVVTLANGSRCCYLPKASTYGKGIYQESIALLASGTLEQLIEATAGQIAEMLAR